MPKITREKFDTYKNVFDQFAIRNLFKLSSEGFFDEVDSPLSLGKEANIFLAGRTGAKPVIVKIYRLENCNFNKMYDYIKQDPRYENLSSKRREIIFAWTQREFRNLIKARECIRVPTPMKFLYNILVMELIGKDETPAPMLKDEAPENPQEFFDKVIGNMAKLYQNGLVHADLSQFNILNNCGEPVFIDFSQATVVENQEANELLKRDIKNVASYFRMRLKCRADEEEIFNKIISNKSK